MFKKNLIRQVTLFDRRSKIQCSYCRVDVFDHYKDQTVRHKNANKYNIFDTKYY